MTLHVDRFVWVPIDSMDYEGALDSSAGLSIWLDKFQTWVSQCLANNPASFRAGSGTATVLLLRDEPVSLHHIAFCNAGIALVFFWFCPSSVTWMVVVTAHRAAVNTSLISRCPVSSFKTNCKQKHTKQTALQIIYELYSTAYFQVMYHYVSIRYYDLLQWNLPSHGFSRTDHLLDRNSN